MAVPYAILTVKEIEANVEEAIRTLAALPDRERKWIYGQLTAWSEIIRQVVEAYGYDDAKARRPHPEPGAIDRMLPVLQWLRWCEEREIRLIQARAWGITWWRLASKYGRSERTIQNWHTRAMERIAINLARPRNNIAHIS